MEVFMAWEPGQWKPKDYTDQPLPLPAEGAGAAQGAGAANKPAPAAGGGAESLASKLRRLELISNWGKSPVSNEAQWSAFKANHTIRIIDKDHP